MRRWLKRAFLATVIIWLLLVLFAHRWFAVTGPSGSRNLVVEGWLYAGGCDTVAAWYRAGTYDRFFTTGTIRPFAYYLNDGDTLVVGFPEPISGNASIRLDGLPKASARIIAGTDTIALPASSTPMRFTLRDCKELRIAALSSEPPRDGTPEIFAGHLTINGVSAHETATAIRVFRASGLAEDGWPSYAHEARACLIEMGIPSDRITPVPARGVSGGRTWSNASAFAAFASEHGIEEFDIATMGVHARRTWRSYRKAARRNEGIGIRSIHDPWCARGRWWLNPIGWILVLKEIVAIPAPSLITDEAEGMKR